MPLPVLTRLGTDPVLPILSTVPRSGTWLLRYSISFFLHLRSGGRITDRITGQTYGNGGGSPFDFEAFEGGPLFATGGTFPAESLFIGHTVCPGFSRLAGKSAWWQSTPFHIRGYDFLHDGLNYDFTRLEFGRSGFAPISPERLETLAWNDTRQRMVLVYREPVAQAESLYQFCQGHPVPEYRRWRGRPLGDIDFRDYLLEAALPSYGKQFVSYLQMAACLPEQVKLVPYETLIHQPGRTLAQILGFLAGRAGFDSIELRLAVHLARQEHLKAIEKELDRSLSDSRSNGGSHIQTPAGRAAARACDTGLYDEVVRRLVSWGISPDHFVWPQAELPDRRAGAGRRR